MATQLSEIRTEILETAGLASDDSRFPDATMNRIVNRALRAINAERDWPWNQRQTNLTTTANVQFTNFPTQLSKVLRLEIDGRNLQQVTPQEGGTYSQLTGEPHVYWVEHDKIHWGPVPDGTYTVYCAYHGYEDALSADGDTPNLPDRYIDWLVQTALVQISQRIRDTDLYSMADRERRAWSRKAADDARRSAASSKVKSRDDWWI